MTKIEDGTGITEDLLRDLLLEQHPDLAELPLREVQGGWGNQMWRLGDTLPARGSQMAVMGVTWITREPART